VELRALPSIDELLRDESIAHLPRHVTLTAAREVLVEARTRMAAGDDPGDLATAVLGRASHALSPRLHKVINATGILLHTNLGRAPLPSAALAHVTEICGGYSNLELDLSTGKRGSRHAHLAEILRALTGAEDALVLNNNAAAVLLALAAFADGGEVLVSRGELIEIGDGFRLPDVLAQSGARLVEVGTTNRTRISDYEHALGPETSLIARIHQSNFRMLGFTARPELSDLVSLSDRAGLPLLDDLGSGTLVPLYDEPLARDSIRAGAGVVTFSGDKLLGGPQAGIVVGRRDLVERMRRHPLQRALRPDKLTLAALEGTLLLHLDPERALREIPTLAMLHEPLDRIRARALRLAELVGGEVVDSTARVGGGALPLQELDSAACSIEAALQGPLRHGTPAIVAIARDGRTLLDCRTIRDDDVSSVAAAVERCRNR
jgi:L-seryl-tRNA(Ser) seleniumtransferase